MMNKDVIVTYRRTQLRDIPVEFLVPGYYQPRQQFSQDGLDSLAQTIERIGILEPLAVRVLSTSPERYEIIAGERRFRAAMQVGLATVPCVISNYSDEEAAQIALIENTCREDLNPMSKAKAMQRLIDEFDYTHEQLGNILGIKRATVTNQLRLLTLDPRIQVWIYQGELAESHGKVLAGVPLEKQYELAYESIRQGWSVYLLDQAVSSWRAKKPMKGKSPRQQCAKLATIEQQLSLQLGCPIAIKVKQNEAGYFRIDFSDATHMQQVIDKLAWPKRTES